MPQKIKAVFVCTLITVVWLILFECSNAQQRLVPGKQDTTQSLLTRKNLITAGIVAHTAFIFIIEYKWWRKGNYHPFSFIREGTWNDIFLGVDKLGHMYTHYV